MLGAALQPSWPFLPSQGFTSPWQQLRKLWTHGRGDRDPVAGLGAGMVWLEAFPAALPPFLPVEITMCCQRQFKDQCEMSLQGGKASNPTKCRQCPSLPSASTTAQPPAPGVGWILQSMQRGTSPFSQNPAGQQAVEGPVPLPM